MACQKVVSMQIVIRMTKQGQGHEKYRDQEKVLHYKVVRIDLTENVSFELRLEGDREVGQVNI